ncbi:MAG: hypothetical protein MUF05_01145 [Candidatus Omnitrophica bacterium]|jgi:hypothetical protein|nr:hypothetical protein [Candidatus Omnitrophota bacterium]
MLKNILGAHVGVLMLSLFFVHFAYSEESNYSVSGFSSSQDYNYYTPKFNFDYSTMYSSYHNMSFDATMKAYNSANSIKNMPQYTVPSYMTNTVTMPQNSYLSSMASNQYLQNLSQKQLTAGSLLTADVLNNRGLLNESASSLLSGDAAKPINITSIDKPQLPLAQVKSLEQYISGQASAQQEK